jgi:hypothetical protein
MGIVIVLSFLLPLHHSLSSFLDYLWNLARSKSLLCLKHVFGFEPFENSCINHAPFPLHTVVHFYLTPVHLTLEEFNTGVTFS